MHRGCFQDEVLAISEKVVLRLEDLLTWITIDTEWSWGRCGVHEKDVDIPPPEIIPKAEVNVVNNQDVVNANCTSQTPVRPSTSLIESNLDFSEVEKERKHLGEYLRYRQ